MLNKLIKKLSDRSAKKEMDVFLSLISVGSDEDMAMMLVSTSLARQFLITSKHMARPFPEEHFRGTGILNKHADIELTKYNIELV